MGTYMLTTAFSPFDWDVMGPLVSIRISNDGGATWDEPVLTQSSRNESLFGEFSVAGSRSHKIKFGAFKSCFFRGEDMGIASMFQVYVQT